VYVLAFLSIKEYFSNRTYGFLILTIIKEILKGLLIFQKYFNDYAPQISLIAVLFGSSPISASAFIIGLYATESDEYT
jgi:hypothetical protein